MVAVPGGHHLDQGRVERAGSIDVLAPGVLLGGPVGAGPEALGGAGGATVEVAREDDRAGGRTTGQERPELGALWVVCRHLIGLVGGEVRGAHDVDSGGHGSWLRSTARWGWNAALCCPAASDRTPVERHPGAGRDMYAPENVALSRGRD